MKNSVGQIDTSVISHCFPTVFVFRLREAHKNSVGQKSLVYIELSTRPSLSIVNCQLSIVISYTEFDEDI